MPCVLIIMYLILCLISSNIHWSTSPKPANDNPQVNDWNLCLTTKQQLIQCIMNKHVLSLAEENQLWLVMFWWSISLPQSAPSTLSASSSCWQTRRCLRCSLSLSSPAWSPVWWRCQSSPHQHCSAPAECPAWSKGGSSSLSWWSWSWRRHWRAHHDQARPCSGTGWPQVVGCLAPLAEGRKFYGYVWMHIQSVFN